ncbi:MAG: FHA domain-containing protein [Caldilineaceae bacterium]
MSRLPVFSDVVQTRLNVGLAPTPAFFIPTATSTVVPTATPTPTPTATATAVWDGYVSLALTPVAMLIPETIRTNRNFTQPLRLVLPLLAVIAFIIAWMAWQRAKNIRIPDEINPNPDQTTNKITAVPMDTRPKAQLVLIQGERSLPAIISLYERRTKFGRDPNWADEVLPNRFVSLQQFAITLEDEYQNLADFSVNHHTHLDGIAAEKGKEDDPEKGSPLRSGSIIQFGPFKYKFQFITQFDSTEDYYASHNGSASSIGSPHV